ncbi:MAG: hypothetical protein WD069_09160 [Planctomycetales bacterium]
MNSPGVFASVCIALCALICGNAAWAASDLDEFRVKREEVFEFAAKPQVTLDGDHATISFETKGFCDVTVAIEDGGGKIIRHLASGVLGPNAPAPFETDSKRQTLHWDGKDDAGRYVDHKEQCTVRVSLGLNPRFERTLNWSPHKRTGNACPLVGPTPEGVYVYEGRGADHVKLFDHEGNYLRTIYPFPANKVDQVQGIERREFPQDGRTLPVKQGFVQATLLSSGTSALFELPYKFGDGYAAQSMAVQGDRIALCYDHLNRLATDGTTGGLSLTGPQVGRRARWKGYGSYGGGEDIIGATSVAFDPSGKKLYLTGYMWREYYMGQGNCLNGVVVMDYEGDAKPALFAGEMQGDSALGTDDKHFQVPSGVACDAQGRVYVADHMNDRVQVFAPDGKFLKTVRTPKPAEVEVDPRTGEIWVFSWPVYGIPDSLLRQTEFQWDKLEPALTRFASFDDPRQISRQPLSLAFGNRGFFLTGKMLDVKVDWWAKEPVLWVATRKYNVSRIDVAWGGGGAYDGRNRDAWKDDGIRLLAERDGKWVDLKSFPERAKPLVERLKPADFGRQRLYVNPADEKLYVGEDSGFGKSFFEMVRIDPETGKIDLFDIPFDAEDICFDQEGLIYLRTDTLIVRYDPKTWREIPWDYGEEHPQVGFSTLGGSRRTDVTSGLPTPGQRPVCWNQGGMAVSAKGYLVVSVCSRAEEADRREREGAFERTRSQANVGKPYTPFIYPGRMRWQEVHVWDRHGKLVYEDAVPGTTIVNGIGMDARDDIYLMDSPTRILDGKPYFNEMAGTVMKFTPRKGRVVSSSGRATVPVSKGQEPDDDFDIANGKVGRAWVQGAHWLYGGVGYGGFNTSRAGGGCHCWNSKFELDYFGRSFAPEVDHYSVAVLDPAGNLILRVGRYGNVDDGVPLARGRREPAGTDRGADAPRSPARSIGGDEVALFHAAYVATHTDRRLFITDTGNARVVSVRLDYHTTENIPLKDVLSRAGGSR